MVWGGSGTVTPPSPPSFPPPPRQLQGPPRAPPPQEEELQRLRAEAAVGRELIAMQHRCLQVGGEPNIWGGVPIFLGGGA